MPQTLHPAGFVPQDVRDLLLAAPRPQELRLCSSDALSPLPMPCPLSLHPATVTGGVPEASWRRRGWDTDDGDVWCWVKEGSWLQGQWGLEGEDEPPWVGVMAGRCLN